MHAGDLWNWTPWIEFLRYPRRELSNSAFKKLLGFAILHPGVATLLWVGAMIRWYYSEKIQTAKCICPNWQIYISPNCQKYLSKLPNVFVQIAKCICTKNSHWLCNSALSEWGCIRLRGFVRLVDCPNQLICWFPFCICFDPTDLLISILYLFRTGPDQITKANALQGFSSFSQTTLKCGAAVHWNLKDIAR